MKTITIEELVALVKRMGQEHGVVNVTVCDAGLDGTWVDANGDVFRGAVKIDSHNVRVPREEDGTAADELRALGARLKIVEQVFDELELKVQALGGVAGK